MGENPFQIFITHGEEGRTRVHIQQLDRHDGSYIVRYKLYQALNDVKIAVTYRGVHVGSSPYIMKGEDLSYSYFQHCAMCVENLFQSFLKKVIHHVTFFSR